MKTLKTAESTLAIPISEQDYSVIINDTIQQYQNQVPNTYSNINYNQNVITFLIFYRINYQMEHHIYIIYAHYIQKI